MGNIVYPRTLSLLHFDGADNSTTIVESGPFSAQATVTAHGNAKLQTAEKVFGSAALGQTDSLTGVPATPTDNYPAQSPDDPHYASVSLLLRGATSIADLSSAARAITVVGQTQLSSASTVFGDSSILFDGTGDRLTLAASSAWNLGNTFTIEFWARPLSLPAAGNWCRVIMTGSNGSGSALVIQFTNTGQIGLGIALGGTDSCYTEAGAFTTDGWHHYAVYVLAGKAFWAKDGVRISGVFPFAGQSATSSDGLQIGYDTVATVNTGYHGYLKNIRITKGVSRGPEVPTASNYARVSGSHLAIGNALRKPFRITMRVRPTSLVNGYNILFDSRNTAFNNGIVIYALPTGAVGAAVVNFPSSTRSAVSAAGAVVVGAWHYVVLEYQADMSSGAGTSGHFRLCVDGKLRAQSGLVSSGIESNITTTEYFIGGNPIIPLESFIGQIDEVAVTTGHMFAPATIAGHNFTGTIGADFEAIPHSAFEDTADGATVLGPRVEGVSLRPFVPFSASVRPMAELIQRTNISGSGSVTGTVKVKGTPNYPVYRKVRLYREHDGICLAEQWSDPVTGAYAFNGLDPAFRYTVISYDHTQAFRAVIADNLTPEF